MKGSDLYLAKIRERHKDVKDAWVAFLRCSTKGDVDAATGSARELGQMLARLKDLLTEQATPAWLTDMLDNAQKLGRPNYYNNDQQRMNSLNSLLRRADAMAAHGFDDEEDDVAPLVSWDEIEKRHHDQAEVDELYDRAIELIQSVLDSGEVDSRRVTRDLQRILATIEQAKSSSFLNQRLQMHELRLWLGAVGKVGARKIPVLKTLVEVVEEVDKKLEVTNEEILKELREIREEQARVLCEVMERQPVIELRPGQIGTEQVIEHQPIEDGDDSPQGDGDGARE